MDLSDASEKIPSDTTEDRSGAFWIEAKRLSHYATPGPGGGDDDDNVGEEAQSV
jgi:hypothetical protein